MIYLHYKDTKTFGHSFSFLLIFKTLRASYLQVGNFSQVTRERFELPTTTFGLSCSCPAELTSRLELQVGFEPTTCSLQVSCTATVLLKQNTVVGTRFELVWAE